MKISEELNTLGYIERYIEIVRIQFDLGYLIEYVETVEVNKNITETYENSIHFYSIGELYNFVHEYGLVDDIKDSNILSKLGQYEEMINSEEYKQEQELKKARQKSECAARELEELKTDIKRKNILKSLDKEELISLIYDIEKFDYGYDGFDMESFWKHIEVLNEGSN